MRDSTVNGLSIAPHRFAYGFHPQVWWSWLIGTAFFCGEIGGGLFLVSMLIDQQLAPPPADCDVYLLMRGENSVARAQQLAESMRDAMPRLNLVVHSGAGSFKSQMRKADKSGARIAIILGESELAAGTVAVKYLREQRDQVEIAQAEIVSRLMSLLN